MTIENIYKLMKEKGQRITNQKKSILSVFIDNHNKLLSVNQVLEILPKSENINAATVYRNIQNFLELDILESIVDDAGNVKYMIKCSNEHHHHLICLKCGKIIPIKCNRNMFKEITDRNNFEEAYHTLIIYGRCKDCAKRIN